MLLSGYSWADVLSWLIGLLVLYEVSVYVICTYGKKIFGPNKKGYELDDGSGEESTESRIARIDELDESSYESNEYHEVSDEQLESDIGESRVVVENPPPEKSENDVDVGEDGMYHSKFPDEIDGFDKNSTSGNDSGKDSDQPLHENDDGSEDKDLPQNIETESIEDNPDDIERNFEIAEDDVFYSNEEVKNLDFGLFSKDNVIQDNVLGKDEETDSGNLPNLTSELIKTDGDGTEIGKNDINFEDCNFYELTKELEKNKEKSLMYISKFNNGDEIDKNENKNSENRNETGTASEDAPDQEEPDD